MKNIKKFLLACFVFVLLLSLCACNTPNTDTTGSGDNGANNSDPIDALKSFDQGDKIQVKVDEGTGWYVDYLTLTNASGDKLSDLCATGMSYAELDLTKYSITVNGEAATADTVVKASAKVILTQKTPEQLTLKEGEIKITIELYDPNTGREQGMYYAGTSGMTLKNFFETTVTEGKQTYEDFAKSYDMYVNGKKASGSSILTADAYVFGCYTKKTDSGNNGGVKEETIEVLFDCTYADGSTESSKLSVIAKDGKITLDAFIKSYTRLGDYASSALRGAWNLDGKYVQSGEALLGNGSIVSYVQHMVADKSIVVLRIVSSMRWTETPIAIESNSITLGELVETYIQPGSSFADTLERIDWTYNGAPATADTVITNATTVYATQKGTEIPKPGADEVKVGVTISDIESGMKSGMDVIIPKDGITLKSLYEDYMGGQSFETLLESVEWYVDGQIATADTKITEKSVIVAIQVDTPEPTPPTPEMTIDFEIDFGDIHSAGEVMVRGESISLETLYTEHLSNGSSVAFEKMTFAETLKLGTWTVNGVKADAGTIVKDGDKIAYRGNDGDVDDNPQITVSFVVEFLGSQTVSQSFTVHSQITLEKLYNEYLKGDDTLSFEATCADGTWSINGKDVTDGSIELFDGDKIVYRVSGNGGGDTEIKVNVTVIAPGYRESEELTVKAPLTLRELFHQYLSGGSELFESTLEEGTWTVNGKQVTDGDVQLSNGDDIVYSVNTSGGDNEITITFTVNTPYGSQSVPLTVTSPITLRELFENYLNGDDNTAFEDTLEEGSWQINGKDVGPEVEIHNGDEIIYTVKGSEDIKYITVTIEYIIYDENGTHTERESYRVIEGTTLKAFVDDYSDVYYEESLAYRTWYVNGKEVGAAFTLIDGDIVSYDEIPYITIFYVMAAGTQWQQTAITVSGEMTLAEFFADYLADGGDINDTLNDYKWYVNDEPATPDTVLKDYDTVKVTKNDTPPVEPGEDEYVYYLTFVGNADDTLRGVTIILNQSSIELNMLYAYYCEMEGISKDTFENYEWTLGMNTLEHDTVVYAGADIWATLKDQGGEVTPPVTNSFRITLNYLSDNGYGTYTNVLVQDYTELELEKLFDLYLSATFGGSFTDYQWSIDGKEIDGSFILRDGMTLTMRKTGGITPPVYTGIVVTLNSFYADGTSSSLGIFMQNVAEIELGKAFDLYFSKNLSGKFEDYEWSVDGKENLDGTFILTSGMTVSALEKKSSGTDPDEKAPVTLVIKLPSGGVQTDLIYLDVASIALRELCAQYAGGSYEESLQYGTWYINDKPANADTVVVPGDRVVFELTKTDIDTTVEALVIIEGMLKTVGSHRSGILLADILALYVEDVKSLVQDYNFYCNGQPADLTTVISGMSAIELYLKKTDVDMITITIGAEAGNLYQAYGARVPAGSTVRYLAGRYSVGGDGSDIDPDYILKIMGFYRDGVLLDADSVVYDGDTLVMKQKTEEPPTEDVVTVVIQYPDGTVEKQPISITEASITLGELISKYMNGTYEDTAEYVTWYLYGEKADAKTIVVPGDVLTMQVNGAVIEPDWITVGIRNKMDLSAPVQTVRVPGGSTVYDVIYAISGEQAEMVLSMCHFFLQGVYVQSDYALNGECTLDMVLDMREEGDITVYYKGTERTLPVGCNFYIPAGMTVQEFFNTQLDYEGYSYITSNEFIVYVNGEVAAASTVLNDGDVIAIVHISTDPHYVTEKITVTLIDTETGEKEVFKLPEGATLWYFLECMNGGNSSDILEFFTFYCNEKPIFATDRLYDGDVISWKEGGSGDDVREEMEVVILVEGVDGNQQFFATAPEGSAWADVIAVYVMDLKSFTNEYNCYRDGKLIDLSTVIYDGDIIEVYLKKNDVDMITVTLITEENGMEMIQTIRIHAGSTLNYLAERYSDQSAEEILATMNFYRDGELLTGESILYDGDVLYLEQRVPAREDMEIHLEMQSESGSIIQFSYNIEGKSQIALDEFLQTYLSVSLADIMSAGTCYVNDKPIYDAGYYLYHGDTVRLVTNGDNIPDEGCNHDWDSTTGYCRICDEICPEYDKHDYLTSMCPVCGYGTNGGAMQYTPVYIIRDNMESMYTIVTEPGQIPTIEDVLLQVYGESFTALNETYRILCDGIEIYDAYYMIHGSTIELIDRNGEWIPPVIEPIQEYNVLLSHYFYDSYYPTDENGNPILDKWWSWYTSYDFWVSGEQSIRSLINWYGIEMNETDLIFVNGERVSDIDSYFMMSENMYITVIDARLPFNGITVTVENEVTGENAVYRYTAPMHRNQLYDLIFGDVDMSAYDCCFYGIVGDESFNINSNDIFVVDIKIVVQETINYVYGDVVDAYGGVAHREFMIPGAMPTLSVFIAEYVGGTLSDYRVFDLSGGMLHELTAEDVVPYSAFIIIPKDLVQSSITVTYQLNLPYSEENLRTGTMVLDGPVILADIFARTDLEFDANQIWGNLQMYDVRINGIPLNDDKDAYYTLLWRDITLIAAPCYTFDLSVEMDVPTLENYRVKVTDPNTTFAEVLALAGLKNTDMVILDYPLTDTVGMYYSYGYCYLNIRLKTNHFRIMIADQYGNERDFVIDIPLAANAEQLFMYLHNQGYGVEGLFEDYRLICTDPMSGNKYDITDSSYTWAYAGDGCYELRLESNMIYVSVEILNMSGEMLQNHYGMQIERGMTSAQITEMFGYPIDEVLYFRTEYYGDCSGDTILQGNDRLYVYINRFHLNVYVYGTPDRDQYFTFTDIRGGEMTVAQVLEQIGYTWEDFSMVTLDNYQTGGREAFADTVIEAGDILNLHYAATQEFSVWVGVIDGYGNMIYSNEIRVMDAISVGDLLVQCGYSWDQIESVYYSNGYATMDTVITGADKVEIRLYAMEDTVREFSVWVGVIDGYGNMIYSNEIRVIDAISVGDLLVQCGYSWDQIESVYYSNGYATMDTVITGADKVEIRLYAMEDTVREFSVWVGVIDGYGNMIYSNEIRVMDAISVGDLLMQCCGYSWDQIESVYYSNGYATMDTVITGADKVEIRLYADENGDDACNHWNIATERQDATCTDYGYVREYCADCGYELKRAELGLIGHLSDENNESCVYCGIHVNRPGDGDCDHPMISREHEKQEATCWMVGFERTYCGECGEVLSYLEHAMLDHYYQVTFYEPTCQHGGYSEYICNRCDYYYVDNYTDPVEHHFLPALAEDGTVAEGGGYYCIYCGLLREEDCEHTNIASKSSHYVTCTEDGYETTYCVDCGYVLESLVIPALGHCFPEASNVCERCGDGCEHMYYQKFYPATCQQGGYTVYTCERCGDSYTGNYTGPTEHNFVAYDTDEYGDPGYFLLCMDCGLRIDDEGLDAEGNLIK